MLPMLKTFGACAVAASLLAVQPALAQDADPGIDVANRTVKIGAFTSVTGPVAFYHQITDGLNAYFKSVNDAGGIDGWEIEYITLDDGYQPSQSMAVARRLVENDEVFALVGTIGTTTSAAVLPYAQEVGVPVYPVGGAPAFYTAENYFTLVPSYTWEGGGMAQFATETLASTNIALLWQNDELGRAGKLGVDKYLESIGSKTTVDLSIEVKQTDFSAHILRLQESNADVVLIFGSNANLASALKAADRIGYKPKWMAAFFAGDPATYKLAGDLLEGVYISSWLLPVTSADPQIVAFRDAMSKYYPDTPKGVLSLNGWSHATLFRLGFEKLLASGDPLTRANLIKVMDSLADVQPGGARNVTFREGDHRGSRQMAVLQAEDGGFTLIRPFEPFPAVVFDQ